MQNLESAVQSLIQEGGYAAESLGSNVVSFLKGVMGVDATENWVSQGQIDRVVEEVSGD